MSGNATPKIPFGPVQMLVLGFDRVSFDGTIMPELEAQQAQAQAAPAPQASQVDMVEQLEKLAKLKEEGILTDAEFEVQKAKVLAGMS